LPGKLLLRNCFFDVVSSRYPFGKWCSLLHNLSFSIGITSFLMKILFFFFSSNTLGLFFFLEILLPPPQRMPSQTFFPSFSSLLLLLSKALFLTGHTIYPEKLHHEPAAASILPPFLYFTICSIHRFFLEITPRSLTCILATVGVTESPWTSALRCLFFLTLLGSIYFGKDQRRFPLAGRNFSLYTPSQKFSPEIFAPSLFGHFGFFFLFQRPGRNFPCGF